MENLEPPKLSICWSIWIQPPPHQLPNWWSKFFQPHIETVKIIIQYVHIHFTLIETKTHIHPRGEKNCLVKFIANINLSKTVKKQMQLKLVLGTMDSKGLSARGSKRVFMTLSVPRRSRGFFTTQCSNRCPVSWKRTWFIPLKSTLMDWNRNCFYTKQEKL